MAGTGPRRASEEGYSWSEPGGPVHAPASLRSRKKARQRAELVRIAQLLFREKGYDATRMDDIATRAEVATKTVYNYFATKQDLLIALLDEDRHRSETAYEAVVDDPPSEPAEALARLIYADLGDVRSDEDKRLWRELLAASTRGHQKPEDEFEANRRLFTRHIERLLRHFQAQGAISSRIDLQLAVDLVYAVNAYDFRYFCASSSCTQDDILKLACGQMRLLVESWKVPETKVRARRQRARVRHG